jgi:putative membrane protein
MIFAPLMMIAFIAVAVAIVVLLVRWLGGGHTTGPGSARKTAIDILEERYARGEIDKDEFLERRRVLME